MIATDDVGKVYVDGELVCSTDKSFTPASFLVSTNDHLIAVEVIN